MDGLAIKVKTADGNGSTGFNLDPTKLNIFEIDMQYQNNMAVIETYRGRITDRIKLIVFQTYFDKGYSTARGHRLRLPSRHGLFSSE